MHFKTSKRAKWTMEKKKQPKKMRNFSVLFFFFFGMVSAFCWPDNYLIALFRKRTLITTFWFGFLLLPNEDDVCFVVCLKAKKKKIFLLHIFTSLIRNSWKMITKKKSRKKQRKKNFYQLDQFLNWKDKQFFFTIVI